MAVANKSFLEKIGFGLTIVCAIHCLAMPFLITLLPFMGHQFQAIHQFEVYIISVSFILAFALLYKDFRRHKNEIPLKLVAFSFLIKSIEWIGNLEKYETYFSVTMAIFIIVAYYLNWQHKKQCACHSGH